MSDSFTLGIDCGSVSLNLVLLSGPGGKPVSVYMRTRGRPVKTFVSAAAKLREEVGCDPLLDGVLVTGSARELFSRRMGVPAINEITAHAVGAYRVNPGIRTIIEIGGQDSKFIRIEPSDESSHPRIVSFRMNEICAAGTGAFLDEQADRLGIPIESFAEIAAQSSRPAAIAGRCAVFAKTDMIHQAQEGTPLADILRGVADALARNYLSALVRGEEFVPLVSLQGGVMANGAVVDAFREVLRLPADSVTVPPHFKVLGALGCAVMAREREFRLTLSDLQTRAESAPSRHIVPSAHKPLERRSPAESSTRDDSSPDSPAPPLIMGLDVGSVSVKGVIADSRGVILREDYRLSQGRPLDTLDQVVEALTRGRMRVDLCAVTGSGRSLAGRLIGADPIVNEISAQAAAALHHDPSVDTIIEIGGQDSKWIALENGGLADFEMNRVCAAGTGSFLMEQTARLGLDMGDEFSDNAFSSAAPCDLGARCTVFMESDLIHHQNNGASTEDLAAGVCLSIVRNYLERVANHKELGERIVFLGGVAANRAVRAAFEQHTGRPMDTPSFHRVSGALGAALKAAEAFAAGRIVPSERKRPIRSLGTIPSERFRCRGCPNRCSVERYKLSDRTVFSGGRCDRWESGKGRPGRGAEEELFGYRVELIEKIAARDTNAGSSPSPSERGETWGMVRSPLFYEWFPFWKTFLDELGIGVTVAPRPNREQFEQGTRFLQVETCLPMKVTAGQVHALVTEGIDTIFHPSVITERQGGAVGRIIEHCPYIQSSSQFVRGAWDIRWLEPVISHALDPGALENECARFAGKLGFSAPRAAAAVARGKEAAARFEKALREKGKAFLDSLGEDERAVVVLGKPYHTSEAFLNMNMGALFRGLGVKAVPSDLLPVEGLPTRSPITWKYQLGILAAARFLAKDPRLFPVMISFFGCGPDPFTVRHVAESLRGKPFLLLEMDEHSSKAGIVTRLEAFLDRVERFRTSGSSGSPARAGRPAETRTAGKGPETGKQRDSDRVRRSRVRGRRVDRIFIPHFSDHSRAFAAAAVSMGIEAEVLPPPDEESARLGRPHLVGGECHPYALIMGDYMKLAERLAPETEKRSLFCIPAYSACRLGQYPVYVEKVRKECGRTMRVVGDLSQAMTAFGVSKKNRDLVFLRTWEGLAAWDLLLETYLELRPRCEDVNALNRAYDRARDALFDRLCHGDAVAGMEAALAELRTAALVERPRRPVIAVTGDYYTRVVPFANNDVYDEIENLGGVIWSPPTFTDGLKVFQLQALTGDGMDTGSEDFENRGSIYAAFLLSFTRMKDLVRTAGGDRGGVDPLGRRMRRLLAPHIDPRLPPGMSAPLATALAAVEDGADAVLNLITLNCSYGTVVTAALARALKTGRNVPMLTLVFDGLKKTNERTRLEAFMEQVHDRFRRRDRVR